MGKKKKSNLRHKLSLVKTEADPMVDHCLVNTRLQDRPTMLLVLGVHRSGTSVTTRFLQCLGAVNSKHLMPPAESNNDKGFFEDLDIFDFNEHQLLTRLGKTWHSLGFTDWSKISFGERSNLVLEAAQIVKKNYSLNNHLSVLKEPRICALLPFWLSVLDHAGFNVKCVCVVRDPLSVAYSLQKRDNLSIAHGGMLYITNWLSILKYIQNIPAFFVNFDEIFTKPLALLHQAASSLDLTLPDSIDIEVYKFSNEFADPSLRHGKFNLNDLHLHSELPPMVVHMYENLLSLVSSQKVNKISKFHQSATRAIDAISPMLSDFDQVIHKAFQKSPHFSEGFLEDSNSEVFHYYKEAHLRGQLAEKLTALHGEVQTLMLTNTTLQQHHTIAEQEKARLQEWNSALQEEKDSLLAANNTLKELHTADEEKLAQLQDSVSVLKEEKHGLESSNFALQQLSTSAQLERGQLLEMLSAVRDQNKILIADKNNLDRQLTESLQQVATLTSQNSTQSKQLNETAQALDRYTRECARMAELIITQRSATDFWRSWITSTTITNAAQGARTQDGDYKHINCYFTGISHLQRNLPHLKIRIINHHGNAGVVIFKPENNSNAFYHWVGSGQENGNEFMLIIPRHLNGRKYLLGATTNDLFLIRSAILFALEDLCVTNNSGQNHFWISQCRFLLSDIEDLPLRLHYDDICVLCNEKQSKSILVKNASYNNVILEKNILTIADGKIESISSASGECYPSYTQASNSQKSILRAYEKELGNILSHLKVK